MNEDSTDTLDVADQVTQRRDPRPIDLHVLEALRKAGFRGINDLSRKLQISHSSLSRVLRGENYGKAAKTFREIASKLNLSVDELLRLIESARDNPLYLHRTDELDYYVGQVDGLTVYLPNRSA